MSTLEFFLVATGLGCWIGAALAVVSAVFRVRHLKRQKF